MSDSVREPSEPTLRELASELASLRERVEDLEDLRDFLAAEHATIADLACYSYVAHAPEGGIPLGEYTSVLAWLRRVEALPHFKPIPPSPIPAST